MRAMSIRLTKTKRKRQKPETIASTAPESVQRWDHHDEPLYIARRQEASRQYRFLAYGPTRETGKKKMRNVCASGLLMLRCHPITTVSLLRASRHRDLQHSDPYPACLARGDTRSTHWEIGAAEGPMNSMRDEIIAEFGYDCRPIAELSRQLQIFRQPE